jgi:hypothetical protein
VSKPSFEEVALDHQPPQNAHADPQRPERVYLSASNSLYLALKVAGYALIGALVVGLPVLLLFILFNIRTGSAIPLP